MKQTRIPRTMEEFIEDGWYDKITAKVSKYKLNDVVNSTEDIVQDIFAQIDSSKYLERYDPEQRNFEVYIYTLVGNAVKKRGTREGSTNGKYIVNHYSLETTQDDSEDTDSGSIFMDRLEQFSFKDDIFQDLTIQELIDQTREALGIFQANSTSVYNGQIINRDPLTVFNFLLEERSVPEIATIFGTSKQFIYELIKKIREVPEIKEWHSYLENHHLIEPTGRKKKKGLSEAFN